MCDVYVLYEDDEDQPFYVGESTRPDVRITEHITDINCNKPKLLRLYGAAKRKGYWEMKLFAYTAGKTSALVLEEVMCYLLQHQITNPVPQPTAMMQKLMPFIITEAGFMLLCQLKHEWKDDPVYQAVLQNIKHIQDDVSYKYQIEATKLNWIAYDGLMRKQEEDATRDALLAFCTK